MWYYVITCWILKWKKQNKCRYTERFISLLKMMYYM